MLRDRDHPVTVPICFAREPLQDIVREQAVGKFRHLQGDFIRATGGNDDPPTTAGEALEEYIAEGRGTRLGSREGAATCCAAVAGIEQYDDPLGGDPPEYARYLVHGERSRVERSCLCVAWDEIAGESVGFGARGVNLRRPVSGEVDEDHIFAIRLAREKVAEGTPDVLKGRLERSTVS